MKAERGQINLPFRDYKPPGATNRKKIMHISQLKQSRFLTRSEVGRGALVTIKDVFQDNVAKEGAPEELRWCVGFSELEKPMVLNSTNGQIIAQITKNEDTDGWVGHKVVLYDDPTVSFGGKLVGGIRVRAPRNQPAPAPPAPTHGPMGKPLNRSMVVTPDSAPAAPAPVGSEPPLTDDDIPF